MPAIATDTLNNHEAGFRLIGHDQGPWPPDKNVYNVFVFGGSTTWGGGNMDGETLPAYLQALLRQRAGTDRINGYNFGAGAHFSTQEVTYLQNRLRDGFIPDMAVFIDGLNDFYFWQGESGASGELRTAFNSGRIKGLSNSIRGLIRSLPIVRLFNMWRVARPGEQA